VPWLVRTILALQRAGIEHCTLVGCPPPPADARIRCALATTPSLTPPADPALRLVVGAGAVIDAALVRDLQGRARPGEVLEVEEEGARVRVAPGPLIFGDGRHAHRPEAGTLRHADAGPAAIERALLVALENPRDGWVDRLVYRRVSRPLTRMLLPTGISPNAVTMVGIAVGVLGGALLAIPGPTAVLAGTVCLIASGILDCVDGEIARIRFAESRLGHWLDVLGDTFVHVAVLAALAIRVAEDGNAPGWPVLALLGLGVLGAFAVISWSEHTEARRHRVEAWENRFLDGVLSPLTTRDWYVFVVVFALIGRLDWLLWGAAFGSHVFWAVTLVALLRVLRY
jgi:phosphatidylglycerophosphate synthase